MKLLILTDGIAPFVIGGMQKHSFQLAKHLAMLGHKITLVHCVYDKNAMPDQESIAASFGIDAMQNLEIISMRFPPAAWYPGHYVKESYIYSKIIYGKLAERLSEFDFIYAKGFTGWHFLEKKKRGQNLPPIGIKFHGYEMLQPPSGLMMRLHNMILRGPTEWNNRNADFIFSYGGKITLIIESLGISNDRIIEIPTGIEASWVSEKIQPISSNLINFVFVGRFERRKGVEELTDSLKNMVDQNDQFHFHFIGPVPPSIQIKSSKITYHGSIKESDKIRDILDQCQILVVPSHSEGMPNVIMEGMARGLAIVATDVGAVASVVDDKNGWFVTPADSAELSAKLLGIIRGEKSVIESKREASLLRIREFTWEKIAALTANRIAVHLK